MNGVKAKKVVFVGLSGGVDSSVAALILSGYARSREARKEKGYEVIGVFMRCFNLDGCAERDAEDARRVAGHLGIPFYVWDFEEEYKQRVVDYMVQGYAQGITPNPDVMCNKEIKFGLFLEKALKMGGTHVATGHYVRLTVSRDRLLTRSSGESQPARAPSKQSASPVYSLSVAKDKNKDQSYFLWTLTQKQLKHCLFPIGSYLKSEVREIARKAGLPTADKKDSQGICFLGKVTLGDFLREYIPEERGPVLSVTGERLGEHQGSHFYTIGQRRGIGIGGGTPYYVAEKDVATNTLVVAPSETHESLYRKEIELTDVNFIRSDLPSLIRANKGIEVLARVRYRQPLALAKLYNLSPNTYHLEFGRPVKFVTPGQSAVFYLKDGEMFGGGIIT
ncbi:MAG: tRNA 2-thiouridine(34) synthase MnmA [Candidatus Liptonbacteria bacterium]|nr:tRNA 2-thiouridine(34) synthase MnmA [Candidatus Liptonbacteria bacterium]